MNKLPKDAKVKNIKQLLREKKLSQQKIGSLFNVARTTITNINLGRIWSWI